MTSRDRENRKSNRGKAREDDGICILLTIKDATETARTNSVSSIADRGRTDGWTISRAVPVVDKGGEVTESFGAATDVAAQWLWT